MDTVGYMMGRDVDAELLGEDTPPPLPLRSGASVESRVLVRLHWM